MTDHRVAWSWPLCVGVTFGVLVAASSAARAQDCTPLLGLFQQGRSTAEIAAMTGLRSDEVEACRQELRKPIFVGPEGPPPVGAAGPPPRRAAGPPPGGAAGPPPAGAAGPPPVGREVKRLP